MGGGSNGGKLTALADPVGFGARKVAGDKGIFLLDPTHALTYDMNPLVQEGKARDEAVELRQQETERQDEIMK